MPVSTEKAAVTTKTSAVEVESGLKLPDYTDTEIIVDNVGLSVREFMSRFEFFKGDKIYIDEAEDDFCFDAKDCFDESQWMSLIGIRYIHKG